MKHQSQSLLVTNETRVSPQISGQPLNIGNGFNALSFKHHQFDSLMDPIVMLDHYTMTEPTFGEHPHAGISAVSIIFEDSEGVFNNKDSLGNNIDLLPGDAYWLRAGVGAIHDEKPTSGSHTHGLQIFVNLPQTLKYDAPAALHVPANEIPIIESKGYRVRVIFGQCNGIQGAMPPTLPFTALDVSLKQNGSFKHQICSNQTTLIHVVSGSARIRIDEQNIDLTEGKAISVQTSSQSQLISILSSDEAHLAVLQGTPIRQHFVQEGPFVMTNLDEMREVTESYKAGLFGVIETAQSEPLEHHESY